MQKYLDINIHSVIVRRFGKYKLIEMLSIFFRFSIKIKFEKWKYLFKYVIEKAPLGHIEYYYTQLVRVSA